MTVALCIISLKPQCRSVSG